MRQLLLEYSDIIRDLRPYPNGAKLATFAYADASLSNRPLHDAKWTRVDSFKALPIGDIKRRQLPTYIFFANENNTAYLIASKTYYSFFLVGPNKNIIHRDISSKITGIAEFRNHVTKILGGPPTAIFYDMQSGERAADRRHYRQTEKDSISSQVWTLKSLIELVRKLVGPILKKYIERTIAEIRGDVMNKIKSGAIRNAEDRMGRLSNLIRAYEGYSLDLEAPLDFANLAAIINMPLVNAIRIVAKKYYPNETHRGLLTRVEELSYNFCDADRAMANSLRNLFERDPEDSQEEYEQKVKLAKQQLGEILHVFKNLLLRL